MKRNSIEIFRQCEQFLERYAPPPRGTALDPGQIGVRPIARAAQVTEQTVFRWLAGDQRPAGSTLHLLRLHAHGLVIPDRKRDWDDFRFRDEHLWWGERYYASATDLRRFFLNY